MKRPHFCGISIFFAFLGVLGSFRLVIFLGDPGMGEIRGFFDFAGPRVPGGPKVGPHTDCVASWDTVGGIQALGGLQGPLPMGFGVAQDGPVAVLAVLQGKFGWKMVDILQVGFCRTQGAQGTPR